MDDSNNCTPDQDQRDLGYQKNDGFHIQTEQLLMLNKIEEEQQSPETEANDNLVDHVQQLARGVETNEKVTLDRNLNNDLNNLQTNNMKANYISQKGIRTDGLIDEANKESRQLSSIASFGQINSGVPQIMQQLSSLNQDKLQLDRSNSILVQNIQQMVSLQPLVDIGSAQQPVQISQSKSSSQNKEGSNQAMETLNMPQLRPRGQAQHNTNRQASNMILQSPNHNIDNTLKPPSLFLSANSKKSTSNSGLGKLPNNFTMRSLKSQNSVTTGGSHTNRADSYFQKSPHTHMSDLQDPYAYFNMHQQKQSVNAPMPVVNRTFNKQMGSHDQELKNLKNEQINYESAKAETNFQPLFGNQVNSCRTNLYGKQQQVISQRSGVQMFGIGGKLISQPQNNLEIQKAKSSKHENSSGQGDGKSSKTLSDTMKLAQNFLSQAEEPFVLNQNQIKFNNQSAFNNVQRKNSSHAKNEPPPNYLMNKHPVSAKTKFGIQQSGESGSRGSNFNSSTSTFPAAPVSKLSDVKNPQKLMTFRFVNQKVTKISEIVQFKNLQELDLSGNMLQEQVKELGCLNFLKRLSLYNNKISDMWILPSSLEIVNLSFNYIKKMPLETCKKLKNVTTLDIQSNKLETLENFEHLSRLKRLLAMNNYVRDLVPLQSIKNIFEIDLESNAVDSHIDFVNLIKGKNDLIVFNLYKNPLMVETETIEKFNEDLIQFAPQYVTQKSSQEIKDIMELIGTAGKSDKEQKVCDTQRYSLHLVEELAEALSFLKQGVLYRNKRVFNKLKAVCLRQHRNVSDISSYSHHDLSVKINKGPLNQITQRKTKNMGSTQDKNSINLTPQSDNKKGLDPSSQPREINKKKTFISQSQMFSPVVDIKSKRYEDVENIYDYIVEQEELKRLKREKILAKKKQEKKKLMMLQLDDKQSNRSEYSDSENNSSQFSDDEIDDDSDGLSIDDTHDFIEPREDYEYDENCLIDQGGSQIIDYPNQRLHDDEVASQTFTSDLDADLHSYKKDGGDVSYNQEKMDDNDYLNGSTAGFGKKLREINREINQEQYEEEEADLNKSNAYSHHRESNNESITKVKIKCKFDLNLDQIKIGKKQMHLQSDLKQTLQNPGRDAITVDYPIDEFNVKKFNLQKQTKTTNNSNENSQCDDEANQTPNQNKIDDQNQLNQSFSIRNLQNQFFLQTNNENIEVESLMMNKQIQAQPNAVGGVQQQSLCIVDMTSNQNETDEGSREQVQTMAEPKSGQQETDNKNSQIISSDSNHNLLLNTESMSFKMPQSNQQQVNQSLNHSLLNNSMAQSIQSVTQTSKKTIIANFKLDLSKCKQDQLEDDFVNEFNESKSPQDMLSSIIQQDNNSSINQSLDEESSIKMKDIVLIYNDISNIENMAIDVDRDSFRNNPTYAKNILKALHKASAPPSKLQEKIPGSENQAQGNKTERDPTPAPIKQRTLKLGGLLNNEEPKPLLKQQGCVNCKKLEQKLTTVHMQYNQELEDLGIQISFYQDIFIKLKQRLNLTGDIDFKINKSAQAKSKKTIKLSGFADLVLMIFKRMYTDLEHQKYYNNNLEIQIKHQQQQLNESIDKYNQVQNVIQSLTNRSIMQSVDLTDHGTPESSNYSKNMCMLKLSNMQSQNTQDVFPKICNKVAKLNQDKYNKLRSKEKEAMKIKMQDMKQNISQMSESSYSDGGDIDQQSDTNKQPQSNSRAQSKKKSAKTVRTLPLSSKEIKSIKKQNRVNSNPKFSLHDKQINNQYVANTFSSNYSLSNNQKAQQVLQAPQIVEEEQVLNQECITENSGLLLQQFTQDSQLHILPNSYQVKVLPSQGQINEQQNPIILQNNMINYQSNTSRSGGKILTTKKIKSPVMHHVQKNFEQIPNILNLSYSNKKQRMQKIEIIQDQDLSSEIIPSQHHNYKTSRMPVTSSLAFIELNYPHDNTADNDQMLHQHLINCENLLVDNNSPQVELMLNDNTTYQQFFSQQINNSTQNFSGGNYINSSQIKSEKRQKQTLTNQNNSIKQSFKTQRKMTQGRNLLNPTLCVSSQRPVDSKTQRIQRQILNKSGVTNIANIINLQQTYDQNIKKQSINAVIGPSNIATDSNSLQMTKRPQSVAERSHGRNSRKSNNKNNQSYLQQTSKSNMKNTQNNSKSSKSKYKSNERKNSRQGMVPSRDTVLSMNNNQQMKYSNAHIDQQVNNLQLNIQNIQLLQNQRFNNSVISKQQDSVQISDVPRNTAALKSKLTTAKLLQERPYSSRTSRFSD